MKYRVEREVLSRNPDIACNCSPLLFRAQAFENAQEAVDYARQWVQQFDGSEIPEADRRWYSASDLPRAHVQAIPASGSKQSKQLMSVFVNLAGEVVERRYDGK